MKNRRERTSASTSSLSRPAGRALRVSSVTGPFSVATVPLPSGARPWMSTGKSRHPHNLHPHNLTRQCPHTQPQSFSRRAARSAGAGPGPGPWIPPGVVRADRP
ncbi:hypothetical protein GCM10009549_27490 [Streptomyces thermoalcalitolerans]|uniref:Uncharacterized protein n=1 Tax=Streptomyces thermoalcalitolerans TaxID=65605 RepID=A0ABN1NQ86_9ACTN